VRICVLYSPAGNGHRAAARAIAEALHREAPDVRVDVLDVLRFAPATFRYDLLWSAIQQHGARFWDVLFELGDRPHPAWKLVRERVNLQLFAPLAAELARVQPDWIVCTHYLPAIAAAYLRRTRRLTGRVATVITDFLAHEAWLCPGTDRYYAASPGVVDALRARGVTGLELVGIPVAPEMDEAPTRPPLAGRVLFLAAGVPRPLVREALACIPRTVEVDVVAGDDPALFDELVRARGQRVHRFVPGLRDLIDRADVVITKAGGLIVSECLARGRAIVLPWPAPGQERGNRDHAIAVGAARACEPRHTGAVLASLPVLAMGRAASHAARRGAARAIAASLVADRDVAVAMRRSGS
jgi:processive 1,2-diacylglycerol beta-glucosyltransferase